MTTLTLIAVALVASLLGAAVGTLATLRLTRPQRTAKPARAKPHVAHVQQRVPRAPEPAVFTPGRVEPSPLARRWTP